MDGAAMHTGLTALLAATGNGFLDGVDNYFHSSAWPITRNLVFLFLTLFWLAIAWWAVHDARRRIEDPWLVGVAGLVALALPFIGALVYLLFRPPELIEDVRERELEMRAMVERLGRRVLHCPKCRAGVESTFLVCPVCTTRLRKACRGCHAPLEPLWQMCPYCESPADVPVPGSLSGQGAEPFGGSVAPLGRRTAANE